MSRLEDGSVSYVMADPPWSYRMTVGRGVIDYDALPMEIIASHLAATYRILRQDAYLDVWTTKPTHRDWYRADDPLIDAGFDYKSGGGWGKVEAGKARRGELGRPGVGTHWLGDEEDWATYAKGKPRPIGGPRSNHVDAKRKGHSEKPEMGLVRMVERATRPGDLVYEVYAGKSASLALVCRQLGRRYVGAEIDPQRAEKARDNLAQTTMFDLGGSR